MKILLDDGSQIAAGDLKVGMKVLTQHEETMRSGSYEVTHTSTVHAERLKLTIGQVDFVCSKSHKFYSEGSWIEAETLKVGDVIGDSVVLAVKEFDSGEVVKITVDSAHTYICEGLLSHNKSEYTPMMKSKDTNVSW
jgi:intein/homing endonuclease